MTVSTLIICVDALDPRLCDRWSDSLATLSQLSAEGVRTELRSTLPATTGVAWPSIMTGKTPGKTGVSSFRDGDSIVDRNSVQSEYLWELADDHGQSTCSISVPVSYPPHDLNTGIVVSGMLTPESATDWITPEELADELPEPEFDTGHAPLERLLSAVERRLTFSLDLLGQQDWDLFTTTFLETDRGGHSLLVPTRNGGVEGYDELKRVYTAVDDAIGTIIEKADPQNVIIVSDHGFGRSPDRYVNMNRWLEQQGYLEIDASEPTVSKERVEHLLDDLQLIDRIPAKIKQVGRRVLPTERTSVEDAKEGSTAAYEQAANGGGVRVLNSDEQTVDSIVSELGSFTDPETGEAVFDHVIKRDELYTGEHTGLFPEILVFPNDRYYPRPVRGKTLYEPITANREDLVLHRRNGVMIANGPGFTSNAQDVPECIDTWDFLPTVCQLLGIPIPKDVDGTVQRTLFAEGSVFRNAEVKTGEPSAVTHTSSGSDSEAVKDRLEDLGYL